MDTTRNPREFKITFSRLGSSEAIPDVVTETEKIGSHGLPIYTGSLNEDEDTLEAEVAAGDGLSVFYLIGWRGGPDINPTPMQIIPV